VAETDRLEDFSTSEFTFDGKTRTVYRIGTGPAVIVISEIPGITPDVAAFARRVAGLGCTAVMPHVFGVPGKDLSGLYGLSVIASQCVSREFTAFATRKTSPITVWLRALAKAAHAECGGPGVGVVGMCFTGGFALAMMVDETVLAPVLSQPSLPFPVTRRHRRDLGIDDKDLAKVKERVAGGTRVVGLRFTCDRFAPAERFGRLREELGDGFVGVEIDSSPGNQWGIPKTAHSVLTRDLTDTPGHPTRDALDTVFDLLRERLLSDT